MFSGGFRGFPGGFGFGGMGEEETSGSQGEVDNKTLYELLGVAPQSTTDEVKKAFRKKAVKEHPDKGGDPEKFKKLTEAYEILSNPEKKDLYDRFGMEGVKNGGGGGDMGDIFSHFFGGGGGRREQGPKKMKAKMREQQVTLEEVFEGKMIHLTHKRKRVCEGCEGKGGANAKTCTTCKGRGMVQKLQMIGPGMYSQSTGPCTDCGGDGTIFPEKDRCKKCKGNKVIDQEKVIEIPLERGVPDEHDYQFYGESDELPGVMAGDLYIRIKIKKHDVYERKGADLYINKKITLVEALTGTQFTLKFLDGTNLHIATKAGEIISPAQIKTVKKKGMPCYKDAMSEGDLHIRFEVEFPLPGQLKNDQIEQLKKVLPGPKQQPKLDAKKTLYLEEYDEAHVNSNPEGGKKDEEDDDDERGGHGGQRVQCAQQ
ncbi:unnamed protein product [Paramecium sonneborni]|uniref:Uncharacterized protein n=1 Tax=Paramecium sonneborni TaxID=65129 RepID=A0A8S1MRH8_9CILI|nr:unnamed protein product [Paramecium sonneborni]